ncbi:hypothetical protein NSMM_540023 [Nitrosomonas mobilis]|uniref:Uncharacterized protein n=1 Tax=Nitrosomonas mobilis TaxID=51642 RepID=A0A1G5SHS9_9PROT|nr:hypothetical protein NSMM_540023 [Nitrosomonas mobilis]
MFSFASNFLLIFIIIFTYIVAVIFFLFLAFRFHCIPFPTALPSRCFFRSCLAEQDIVEHTVRIRSG